jgi:hypothetical protein
MSSVKKLLNYFYPDIWMLKFNPAYLHHVNGNENEKVKESAENATK